MQVPETCAAAPCNEGGSVVTARSPLVVQFIQGLRHVAPGPRPRMRADHEVQQVAQDVFVRGSSPPIFQKQTGEQQVVNVKTSLGVRDWTKRHRVYTVDCNTQVLTCCALAASVPRHTLRSGLAEASEMQEQGECVTSETNLRNDACVGISLWVSAHICADAETCMPSSGVARMLSPLRRDRSNDRCVCQTQLHASSVAPQLGAQISVNGSGLSRSRIFSNGHGQY